VTLITDHVFSQKYALVVQPESNKFPPGAKIAIPITIWAFIMAVAGFTIFYVRRKRKARREAEANHVTTFPPEEPAMHQVSRSRAPTAHELDSLDAKSPTPTAVAATGWPIYQATTPPAYDPNKAAASPVVTKQPPAAPQELPGSTYIHEHHPAFSTTESSVGTPTEATAGASAQGTPAAQESPALSTVTPRPEAHSPVFISPLGSPRLAKTE
jgi:hypothetical protein